MSPGRYPGVAKFGIALEWGSRGPEFESQHSDHVAASVISLAATFSCHRALIMLRLLSKSNPLRWASIWFWVRAWVRIAYLLHRGKSLWTIYRSQRLFCSSFCCSFIQDIQSSRRGRCIVRGDFLWKVIARSFLIEPTVLDFNWSDGAWNLAVSMILRKKSLYQALRLSKKAGLFWQKDCGLLQRINRPPGANDFHVCRPRSIFGHVHAAAKNA